MGVMVRAGWGPPQFTGKAFSRDSGMPSMSGNTLIGRLCEGVSQEKPCNPKRLCCDAQPDSERILACGETN